MGERLMAFHTIYGVDGEHSTPYMTRAWFWRLRLHIFHRGDADPDPHDHPWDFWTFPLTPYVEEVTVPDMQGVYPLEALLFPPERYRKVTQVVPAWRWTFRKAEHTHRVLGRFFVTSTGQPGWRAGKIVTIVWRGPNRRKWGFLKNRHGQWCWLGWRDYVFGGGKHAPCEPEGDR